MGAGSWIANLIHDLLFEAMPDCDRQTALRQCAYLLYRVNESNVFCKGVDGYFLDCNTKRLRHIDSRSIRDAIKGAFQLDFILSLAASLPHFSRKASISSTM